MENFLGKTTVCLLLAPLFACGQSAYLTGVQSGFNNGECVAQVPPGFFASPSVLNGQGTGTFNDPWNLEDALANAYPQINGDTLELLPGLYDDPVAGFAGSWIMDTTGVTVRAYPGNATLYSAIVRGQFEVNGVGNTISDIYFRNQDAIPGGEPTGPGSIAPAGWGSVGVFVTSTASNTTIRNNVIEGGAQPISSFSADNTVITGNVAYGWGWRGTDRDHGHTYVRPETGQSMTVENNLISNTRLGRDGKGNFSFAFFATNPIIGTIVVQNNGIKGAVNGSSINQYVESLTWSDNVVEQMNLESIAGGFGSGDGGVSFGQFAHPDLTLVDSTNTYIDTVPSARNGGWTTEIGAGNRVFKTDPDFIRIKVRQPPEDNVTEEGTFTDISGGGGVDESRLNVTTDVNRANVILIDLGKNGSVTFDPSAFLTVGDTYSLFHYTNLAANVAVQSGTYLGGTLTQAIVDNDGVTDDVIDFFVLVKS